MREAAVEKHLRERVEAVGGLCEKHVSPGRRGVPDRLVTWPDGCMQLVETKAPDGVVKGHQQRDHARRARRRVYVRVTYTKQDVDDYMTREVFHYMHVGER